MRFPNIEREPHVEAWLRELDIPELPPGQDPITEFQMIAERPDSAVMPDHILTSWHQHLAHSRQIVDQAEKQFIAQAGRAGWPAERSAIALGLPHDRSLAEHERQLNDRMHRMSPSRDSRPWTGFEWPTP